MARYIDADALKQSFDNVPSMCGWPGMLDLIHKRIDHAQTADVAPVVHGEWITPRKNYRKCSVCGMGYHHHVGDEFDNFCAECGALMEGEKEMRKIDACPYCKRNSASVESYEHDAGTRYRVVCGKCGVRLDSGYWQTPDAAIEAWNTRSNPMWWLPMTEQYPFAEYGEGNLVLTIDALGVMRVAEFNGGNWIDGHGEVITTIREFPITHWMPLPQPPKMDGGEDE